MRDLFSQTVEIRYISREGIPTLSALIFGMEENPGIGFGDLKWDVFHVNFSFGSCLKFQLEMGITHSKLNLYVCVFPRHLDNMEGLMPAVNLAQPNSLSGSKRDNKTIFR